MINSITVASAHLSVWFNEMWETITEHFELFARRLGELGILGSEEKEYSYDYKGAKPSQQLQDQMYLYQTMLIPYGFSDKTEEDYELMLYVNDVNRGYTETLATYGTDGYVNTVYTYGNERLISEQFGKSSYYTYNGRGDVSSLLSDTGAPQVSYSYDAYGNYAATAASDNPYKFNAEAFDYSTGLQYLRARYYDNSIGGFITQDTNMGNIEVPVTLNLYTYVGNDPLNHTDPSGNSWISNALSTVKNTATKALNNVQRAITKTIKNGKIMPTVPSEDPKKIGDKVLDGLKYAKKAYTVVKNIGKKTISCVENKIQQAKSIIKSVSCTGKDWVKTNVKNVTKNVLKPIVKTTQQYLAIKDGTQTVGISINPSTNFISISLQLGVSIDKRGEVALQYTFGVSGGGGTTGISAALYSMKTNAPTIDSLTGLGSNIGGSVGVMVDVVPLYVGYDYNIIPFNPDNENEEPQIYTGETIGIGVGTPGCEFHGGVSITDTIEGTKFNIFQRLEYFYKIIMEW